MVPFFFMASSGIASDVWQLDFSHRSGPGNPSCCWTLGKVLEKRVHFEAKCSPQISCPLASLRLLSTTWVSHTWVWSPSICFELLKYNTHLCQNSLIGQPEEIKSPWLLETMAYIGDLIQETIYRKSYFVRVKLSTILARGHAMGSYFDRVLLTCFKSCKRCFPQEMRKGIMTSENKIDLCWQRSEPATENGPWTKMLISCRLLILSSFSYSQKFIQIHSMGSVQYPKVQVHRS